MLGARLCLQLRARAVLRGRRSDVLLLLLLLLWECVSGVGRGCWCWYGRESADRESDGGEVVVGDWGGGGRGAEGGCVDWDCWA